MANVSICTTKGIKYVRVCESYRNENGEPRSRIIENHGPLEVCEKKDPDYLKKLRERVAKENEKMRMSRLEQIEKTAKERMERYSKKLDNRSAKHYKKFNVGIALIWKVWKDLLMPVYFRGVNKRGKMKYDYDQVAFLLTSQRIINPSSKLNTFKDKDSTILPFDGVTDINQVYRTLDRLCKDKESIVRHLNREIGKKLDRKVTIAFYDVTTYAFESCKENGLLGFGLSKDNKVNEVQVVLGLVVDENGIPLDYELFKGNTNEFGTMLPIIERLKKTYKIGQLIVVADRGLNSSENLIALKKLGCDFVIAQKIRNCSEKEKGFILDDTNWSSVFASEDGEVLCKYKKFETTKQLFETKTSEKTGRNYKTTKELEKMEVTWIVSYSSTRAKKDLSDITRAIQKAQEAIRKGKSKPSSKGYRTFIQVPIATGPAVLNIKKIEEAKKWVGYYAICTSLKTKSPEQIVEIYRKLWQIEDCFRVSKSQLEARPCFVWTESHIKGHFMSCYISLVIEKYMLFKIKKTLGAKAITNETLCSCIREAQVAYDDSDIQLPLYMRLYESELFDKVSEVFGLTALMRSNPPNMICRNLHLGSVNA